MWQLVLPCCSMTDRVTAQCMSSRKAAGLTRREGGEKFLSLANCSDVLVRLSSWMSWVSWSNYSDDPVMSGDCWKYFGTRLITAVQWRKLPVMFSCSVWAMLSVMCFITQSSKKKKVWFIPSARNCVPSVASAISTFVYVDLVELPFVTSGNQVDKKNPLSRFFAIMKLPDSIWRYVTHSLKILIFLCALMRWLPCCQAVFQSGWLLRNAVWDLWRIYWPQRGDWQMGHRDWLRNLDGVTPWLSPGEPPHLQKMSGVSTLMK